MARLRVMAMAAMAALALGGCATFRSLGEYRAKQMDRCADSCCCVCGAGGAARWGCPQRAAP